MGVAVIWRVLYKAYEPANASLLDTDTMICHFTICSGKIVLAFPLEFLFMDLDTHWHQKVMNCFLKYASTPKHVLSVAVNRASKASR